MHKFGTTVRGMIVASALMLGAGPAFAGDEERALAAIAQAQGKISAASRLAATPTSPELLAKAQASLRLAQESYKSGKEQAAIKSAVEAQQYADTMIGESQQQTSTDAQVQASTAATAQQDAAAANARATAAEQAAASAAADARAARAAAATSTTVTTETVKAPATARKTSATRKVVRKTSATAPAATVTERTTTTVTN